MMTKETRLLLELVCARRRLAEDQVSDADGKWLDARLDGIRTELLMLGSKMELDIMMPDEVEAFVFRRVARELADSCP
jgi:hypothetical protein